ncbi:MAG: PEP-CTERM sorting domain-containing protein [Verrucomicrobiales bacterium]
MKNLLLVEALVVLGLSLPSQGALVIGQTIGIDFGATVPVAGSNFNAYTDVEIADGDTESFIPLGSLIDTTGVTVADVGFSVTNNTGEDSNPAVVGAGVQGFGLMSDSSIYQDILISNHAPGQGRNLSNGGNFVLTFVGLDPTLTYDLVGGFDQNNANFNSTWSADGQSATTDGNAPDSDVGFVSLNGLSTDGSGTLEITVTRSNHVAIGGLYLTAVPEPSAASLIGVGVLGVLLRRRRV